MPGWNTLRKEQLKTDEKDQNEEKEDVGKYIKRSYSHDKHAFVETERLKRIKDVSERFRDLLDP